MNLIKKSAIAFTALALLSASCDSDDDKQKSIIGDKEGNVLVTFGSTFEAPQATFKEIDDAAKAKFQGETITWGYTSDDILNKLRKGLGENGLQKDNDSPQEAIVKMIKDGYATLYVQSLHVIPGEEYDELKEAAEKLENEYNGLNIKIGAPLLDSDKDIEDVAKALNTIFANQLAQGPVLLMGHGTPHAADNRYGKIAAELKKLNENFYVGTVEGTGFDANQTTIGAIIENLKQTQATSVTITPLMSIFGDHANNDMNGNTGETNPEDQSWRERLEAEGYTVNCIEKGLGDYPQIVEIWINHLEAIK